jgi:transcriptional regulator with XRE-family HTH domain
MSLTFREKLTKLRKEKGMTLEQLASTSGLKLSTLKGYVVSRKPREGDKREGTQLPSLRNAILLARALEQPTTIWDDCTDWTSPEGEKE